MTADSETTAARASLVEPTSVARPAPATDWTASQLAAEVLRGLGDGPRRILARAPGRLEVLGGSVDYTGGLVLTVPLADHVCVGVRRRDDGCVRCVETPHASGATPREWSGSSAQLRAATAEPAELARVLEEEAASEPIRAIVATLVELLQAGWVDDLGGGLTVAVGSGLMAYTDVGQDAAIASATLAATAQAFGVEIEPQASALLVQRVLNHWLKIPVGPSDAFNALQGEAHSLGQLSCQPCEPRGSIRLPEDVLLLGLDLGARAADCVCRLRRARVAARMGSLLINKIEAFERGEPLGPEGCLARVTVQDYVARFRDRLPTKLTGRDFVARFGASCDPLCPIEPSIVYKIRSRTEHHIYENARAHEFAQALQRALRLGEPAALRQVGELMHSSHWSYGQRCGLGSVESDQLVSHLRAQGAAQDLYGARVTAAGCGGVVAVLLRATERGQSALQAALDAHRAAGGRPVRVLKGSTPGVLVAGPRVM